MQTLFKIIRKGFKTALILSVFTLFLSFFGDYLIAFIYHINLSMYFFLSAYFGNDVISLITISMIILFVIFIVRTAKKII